MKILWLIPVGIIFFGMRREWRRLNPPTSQDILKNIRTEMRSARDKERQEWEWRHAV